LVTTGEYLEACRIIRVDGFNRVATDMFADHFAILATATDAQGDIAGSPVPSQAAKDGYEAFVKAYLAERVVDTDDNDIEDPTLNSYNTPLDSTALTDLEDAAGTDLNLPAQVNITKESPDNPRWVHTRGLYMDYLESEALEIIKDKKDKCGGVKAAMQPKDLGILNPWLRNIRDVYRLHNDELSAIQNEEQRYRRLVELNVEEQCVNVIKTAVFQKAFLSNQRPTLHGWVFDIRHGKLVDLRIDFARKLSGIRELYDLGHSGG
jgi:hypothetical protein